MKITRAQLKQLIREEMGEMGGAPMGGMQVYTEAARIIAESGILPVEVDLDVLASDIANLMEKYRQRQ